MKDMKKILAALFSLALLPCLFAAEEDFSDVEIDEPFRTCLTAKRLYMKTEGVKGFITPDQKKVVVCVVSTPGKGKSGSALAKMIKVCRIKAQVELKKAEGFEISALTRVGNSISVVSDGKRTETETFSSFLDIAEERVSGIVQSWPVVGTWFSKDEKQFYLAIGTTAE